MNFKKYKNNGVIFLWFLFFSFSQPIFAYEIFIYRPYLEKRPFIEEKKFSSMENSLFTSNFLVIFQATTITAEPKTD